MQHFQNEIFEACRELNVEIKPIQAEKLLAYMELLQKWNNTYNLTAITDPHEMLVHHIFDCLAILPALHETIKPFNNLSPEILDVGSGGGLPAVVIAIMCPHYRVISVDAVLKKVTFIRQVAGTLGLSNLSAEHNRIESRIGSRADVVISRAFASLLDFVRLCGDQVAERHPLLAMKGKLPQEEIDELQEKSLWCVTKTQTLTVPQLDADRCLLWLERASTHAIHR